MATLEAGAELNVSVVPAAFNVKAVVATPARVTVRSPVVPVSYTHLRAHET